MRRIVGPVVIALTTSIAVADDQAPTAPPPPAPAPARATDSHLPLRVVRVMPEQHQALLFDKARNTHVLAQLGETVDGLRVDSINDDAVTLSSSHGQIILSAPDRSWRTRRAAQLDPSERPAPATRVMPTDPYAASTPTDPYAAARPVDPYAPAKPIDPYASSQPVDPYADPELRSVEAPAGLDELPGGVNVVSAGGTIAPAVGAAAVGAVAPAIGVAPVISGAVEATAPAVAAAPAVSAVPMVSAAPAPVVAPAGAATINVTVPGATINVTGAVPAPAAVAPMVGAAVAPIGAAAPAAAAAAGSVTVPAPAPATAPAPAPAPAPTVPVIITAAPLDTSLTRAEVRVALADFTRLTSGLKAQLTPTGARIDSVANGSVFAKAGLRAGDVVTSVDGQAMRSIDDAADVYVRASTARNITVQLVRAGKPATLKLSIQ